MKAPFFALKKRLSYQYATERKRLLLNQLALTDRNENQIFLLHVQL